MHSGVHPSLSSELSPSNYFAKFNLTIFYPPPYKRWMTLGVPHPPHAGAPCLPSFLYGHDPNLLADDTALFSTVKVPERTSNNLSNDLKKINKRAFQWKMTFKPDPTKPAQMVIFSWKTTKKTHPKIFFNNISVSKADSQKHLGLHLDSK